MANVTTRVGDGWAIEIDEATLTRNLEDGTRGAAEKGGIDPDFEAALVATEMLTQKYPDIKIEIGMAGEFVLVMRATREDRRLGLLQSLSGRPKGIEAKYNISKLLDIELNSLGSANTRVSG